MRGDIELMGGPPSPSHSGKPLYGYSLHFVLPIALGAIYMGQAIPVEWTGSWFYNSS